MTDKHDDQTREIAVLSTTLELYMKQADINFNRLEKTMIDGFAGLECKDNSGKINEMWADHQKKKNEVKTLRTRIINNVGNIITSAITAAACFIAAKFGIDL